KDLGYRNWHLFVAQNGVQRISCIELGLCFTGILLIVDAAVVAQNSILIKNENMGGGNRAILRGCDFRFSVKQVWKIEVLFLRTDLHVFKRIADVAPTKLIQP